MQYSYESYNLPLYGVVVSSHEIRQTHMFPFVEVLIFKSNNIQQYPIGNVELVSGA
jgi:hypothetical protein